MEGLSNKNYLKLSRKRFDPLALIISGLALGSILIGFKSGETLDKFIDIRSIIIVGVGTVAAMLFQFDFSAVWHGTVILLRSFLGTPDKPVLLIIKQLDDAIINDINLKDLREGGEITGELLNDVVYMHKKGLLFEEIDEFVTARVEAQYSHRQTTKEMLNKAAVISPSLGLFGTVLGLIGVLRSLSDPGQIGPSMSLALMTTAYGAGLGTLVFSPLAGRIEHHNRIYLESHKQMLSKIGILLHREERSLDLLNDPDRMYA